MDLFDNTAGNADKMQYHLRVKPGDVADYVLLPGDPGRVLLIAEHIDEPKDVAYHREYRTVTGAYQGIPVSGTSTGIGCPSASIAVEELANVGVSHFIRVGSSAAFVPGIRKGDILINVASKREDGTTATLVDDGFPAVADHFLTAALIEAGQALSQERGFGLYIGINASADAFLRRDRGSGKEPDEAENPEHRDGKRCDLHDRAPARSKGSVRLCGLVQLHGTGGD